MVAEAAERAGHSVRFVDFMFKKDVLQPLRKSLAEFNPDVVGLSIRNIDNNDYENPIFFVDELKPVIDAIRSQTDAVIVIGGAAVSVMPEELLRSTGASYAVTGDGEVVFPMLLDRLLEGKSPADIPGVARIEDDSFVTTSGPANPCTHECRPVDFAKWLDLDAYLSRLSTVPVQTKLGCHFQCIYCTYRKIEGNVYRLSNPEQVVDTVEQLNSHGFKDIEFVDNVFNYPYHHAMQISEGLARSRCGARLQSLELNPLFVDDDLIEVMEHAGFSGIGITLESASSDVLHGLRKGFTVEDVYKAARVVQRHSLPCAWIFMFGGPGETEATVKETLRFAESFIRQEDIAFFGAGIRIYPGTGLETLAREQGLLTLSPKEMFNPVFYVSPAVEYDWIKRRVRETMDSHMNFISSDSIGLPFLPSIHRAGYRLGLRPPLWRFTRHIRRGLRLFGMDV